MAKQAKKQKQKKKVQSKKSQAKSKNAKAEEPVYGQKSLLRSTQSVLPIETIQNGIVVVREAGGKKRYVKILEIKPNAFTLKAEGDKVRILNSFQSLFVNGPEHFQLSAYSFQSAHTKQLETIDEEWKYDQEHRSDMLDISKQESAQLDNLYAQYKKLVDESQSNSINKRFFLSFEWENKSTSLVAKDAPFETIATEMNETAREVKRILENCDNFVYDIDDKRADWDLAEILYVCLNREKIISDPFEESHAPKIAYQHIYKNSRQWDDIPAVDFFAPDTMDFGVDSRVAKINNTYYEFLYLDKDTGYPSDVSGGWLMNFFDFGIPGIDVHAFFRRENKEAVLRSIRNSATRARAEVGSASDLSQAYADSSKTHNAGMYLLSGLDAEGMEELFSVGVEIVVSGATKEEADKKREIVLKQARNCGIRVRWSQFENYPAFCSSLPLATMDNTIWKKTKRNVLGQDAVSFYLYTTSEFNDPNGIYLGRDRNQANVIIDLFNPKMPSHNTFLCGSTGAGKTFTLIMLAIRLRLMHIPIIMIVPEKESELKRCVKAMGGQFIRIGEGTQNRINLLGIIPHDPSATEMERRIDGEIDDVSDRVERIKQVREFFRLHMGDRMRVDEPALIDRAMNELYDQFDIGYTYESLFVDNNPETKELKPMPTFTDLHAKFKEMTENGSPCETLMNVTYEFSEGSGKSFNGATNVQLDNPFTVIGLEHISDDTMAPLGIFLAMDLAWSKIKEDKTKKIVLFIDEWWSFAKNTVGAAYSNKMVRTIRSYSGALVLASQQLSDALDSASAAYGKAVLNNCKTKIIMHTEKKDLENVRELLDLTDAEADQVENFSSGNALLFMGNTSTKLKFIATPIETDLAATDRETLIKIAERKRKEEEEAEKAAFTVDTSDIESNENSNEEITVDIDDDDELIIDDVFDAEDEIVINEDDNQSETPPNPLLSTMAYKHDNDKSKNALLDSEGGDDDEVVIDAIDESESEEVLDDDDDDMIVVVPNTHQQTLTANSSDYVVEGDDDDDYIVV